MELRRVRAVRATKPVFSAGNALLVEDGTDAWFFTFNGWALPFWRPTSKVAGQWERSITEVLRRPADLVLEDSPALRLARAQIRRIRLAGSALMIALFLLPIVTLALIFAPVAVLLLLPFVPAYLFLTVGVVVLWRYMRSLEAAATPRGGVS